jgi:hypothetical protein
MTREPNVAAAWDIENQQRLEIDLSDVLRLYKPRSSTDDQDPTAIVFVSGGTALVDESTRTLMARWDCLRSTQLHDYDHGEADRPSFVNLDHVCLLTDAQDTEQTTTEMLLIDGDVVRTREYRGTIASKMKGLGMEMREMDLPDGTQTGTLSVQHLDHVKARFLDQEMKQVHDRMTRAFGR